MRAGSARVVAVVCAAVAASSACSAERTAPAAQGAPSASVTAGPLGQPATPSASPPAGAPSAAAPSAAGSGSAPASPPALVERPGALPAAQRLRAPVVPFDQPASFPDGVTLQVRDISHGVTDDTGIGATADVPTTTLVVEVRNGSPRPLDLSGVVVTATSSGARPADPVYGGDQQDLTGVVASGGRAEGTYSFAIPEDGRGDVTLSMDLDGRHLPAVWRGAVTS